MSRPGLYAVVILAALLAPPAPASAQSRFVLTPYIGAWMVDDGLSELDFDFATLELDDEPLPSPDFATEVEAGLLLGVRVGVPVGPSWMVEGSYGYSSFSTEATIEFDDAFPEADLFSIELLEHRAHIFLGALRWTPLLGARVRPYLVAGLGAVRMTTSAGGFLGFEDELQLSATDLLLTAGGGLAVPLRPGLALRAEVRDDLQFCDELCPEGDQTLHNIELTGGLEIDL